MGDGSEGEGGDNPRSESDERFTGSGDNPKSGEDGESDAEKATFRE